MEERKRFNLRIENELLERANVFAERCGASTNDFILECIADKLGHPSGYVGEEKTLHRMMQINTRCMLMLMHLVGNGATDFDFDQSFSTAESLADGFVGYAPPSPTDKT